MKGYPLLEPALSSDPERFQKEVPFWSLVGEGSSILSPPEGLIDSLAMQSQPNVDYISDYLHPHFTDISYEDIYKIVKILLEMNKLLKYLIDKRKSRRPKKWDSTDQSDVLDSLHKNLKLGDAAKRLRVEAMRCGEKTPQFLIFDGISLHLEGSAELGSNRLLEFERKYQPTNQDLQRYLLFRTAKALAGAGHFPQAIQYFSELAEKQVGLERAESIREQCNLYTQLAWTWPRNQSYQKNLEELLPLGKAALGQETHAEFYNRFAKVEASFREFSYTLHLLKSSSSQRNLACLEEIKNAIKDLMEVDKTTGRNRHTHLAALYVRANLPEPALECLSSVRDQIESNMEKGLSWLVEGQALRLTEGRLKSEKQATSFRKGEDLFNNIPGDRFRRIARALRVKADPEASMFDKIGLYAGSILGGNRIIGSFVVRLPTISLS